MGTNVATPEEAPQEREVCPAERALKDFLQTFRTHGKLASEAVLETHTIGEYTVNFNGNPGSYSDLSKKNVGSFFTIEIWNKNKKLTIGHDSVVTDGQLKFALDNNFGFGPGLNIKDPDIEAMIIGLLKKISTDFEESINAKQRESVKKSTSLAEESTQKSAEEKLKTLEALRSLLG